MYAYRDGGSGEWRAAIVLHNPLYRQVGEVRARVGAALDERAYFIAEQTKHLRSLAPYSQGRRVTENDHCWHVLVAIETTCQQPTSALSIDTLVLDLERVGSAGWEFFLPEQRYPRTRRGWRGQVL